MSAGRITIVTGRGNSLGDGHIQRMCALAEFLNSDGFQPFIVTDGDLPPSIRNKEIKALHLRVLPKKTDLIIRDMRDSSLADIKALRAKAPVLVLDDRGRGRTSADAAIDLLPHYEHLNDKKAYRPEAFIYGYGFVNSLKNIGADTLAKDTAFAAYMGQADIGLLLPMLPLSLSGVIISNGKYLKAENGRISGETNRPYAEIIAGAKALITHFGITMYEGALTGASLVALNPSEYHGRLTELAGRELKIANAGLYKNADSENVKEIISSAVKEAKASAVNLKLVAEKTVANLRNFVRLFDELKLLV